MRGKYRIYWASQPPPEGLTSEHLNRLVPVDFTTEQDALHAAALLLRAKQQVWCIERPDGPPMDAAEIQEQCQPLLAIFQPRPVP